MYVPYRAASKNVLVTEICRFLESHPLSVYDVTTLMHVSQAPSPPMESVVKE
jgi:hypothetical protein